MGGGFKVLKQIAEDNDDARDEAWKESAFGELRERLPVDMWRCRE